MIISSWCPNIYKSYHMNLSLIISYIQWQSVSYSHCKLPLKNSSHLSAWGSLQRSKILVHGDVHQNAKLQVSQLHYMIVSYRLFFCVFIPYSKSVFMMHVSELGKSYHFFMSYKLTLAFTTLQSLISCMQSVLSLSPLPWSHALRGFGCFLHHSLCESLYKLLYS